VRGTSGEFFNGKKSSTKHSGYASAGSVFYADSSYVISFEMNGNLLTEN